MTGCVTFKYSKDNQTCTLGGSIDTGVIAQPNEIVEDVFINV